MEIQSHWQEIKSLFICAFNSSFHFSIATVNDQGEPHVTPIGSLILGETGRGIYFEKFTTQLQQNYLINRKVCVLAVNSSKLFWLKSLVLGSFAKPPAIRLYGEVGELRQATDEEVLLWQKRVSSTRWSKGYEIMWEKMSMVRDVEFTRVDIANIGKMTKGNLDNLGLTHSM